MVGVAVDGRIPQAHRLEQHRGRGAAVRRRGIGGSQWLGLRRDARDQRVGGAGFHGDRA